MIIEDIKNVVVIGAGGTGSILLQPLIRFLYSIKYENSITIIDGDSYDESNLKRQMFNASRVGTNKAEYQAMALVSQVPSMSEQIEFVPEYVGIQEIQDIIEEGTVVFNCVDNNAARKYVDDCISTLNCGLHICCGNRERSGQVQCHYRKDGKDVTPDIYKYSPEFNTTDDDISELSCEELAEIPGGGQFIVANMGAAWVALCMFFHLVRTGRSPAETVEYSCDTCRTKVIDNQYEVNLVLDSISSTCMTEDGPVTTERITN